MPSRLASAVAGAALLTAPAAASPAGAAIAWVHLCGSDGAIPIRLPQRRNGDGPAPCHGSACLAAEKKKGRGLPS